VPISFSSSCPRRILARLAATSLGIATTLSLAATLATGARADVDPWAAGSDWLYVRAGYAKSGADGAGDGGGGAGFGFRHMLSPSRVDQWRVFGVRPLPFIPWSLFKNWSFGGFAEYNVLGRYGTAKEIEVPAALDLTRHIQLRGDVKPYFSLGFGPHYRKTYGTGEDFGRIAVSGFVAGGFDVAIAEGQMLGIDVRLARVDAENKPANPVFGPGQNEATHWSVKLAYTLAY
jgi:hypothetical protein